MVGGVPQHILRSLGSIQPRPRETAFQIGKGVWAPRLTAESHTPEAAQHRAQRREECRPAEAEAHGGEEEGSNAALHATYKIGNCMEFNKEDSKPMN